MFERANVKALCREWGLRDDLSLLEHAWDRELGGLGRMARIVALDQKSLVVEVTSSPAMQELVLRRRELLRKINAYFSVPFLHDLQVRMTQHG